MEYKMLGELVDITSGQILSRIINKDIDNQDTSNIKVLTTKSIYDGTIHVDEISAEDIKIQPDYKRLTKVDDIIIKLSTPYDCAIVRDGEENMLVPSFCAIIRNKGLIDNNYLQAFINSDACRTVLKNSVVGSNIAIISIAKIKEVKIPVPSYEKQVEIGKSYKNNIARIEVVKKILDLECQKNDLIFDELMEG